MDQQPNDSTYKLWQGLSDKKLYTKSYEDFQNQFNTEKAIGGLYDGLSTKKLYTKTKEDFTNQFFTTKNTIASTPTKTEEKPVKQEEPYNFEKTFLGNLMGSDWEGSVGRVKATPMQIMQEGVKKPKPTEQVYKAPTGAVDIRTQEDLKKSEEAFEKFTEKRLRGKGIQFKKDDANYKKEKQLVLNDIKNGDIFGYVEDGNLGFARSVGFLRGTAETLINSVANEFKAAKVNTISDPREFADYANQKEETDIREKVPEMASIIGGLPKLIGTISLGESFGGPTGGASLLAADAQWIGMSEKRLELYYNKRNELIDKGIPKEQAEYQAAGAAIQDAPLAAIPSAVTNYVMATMGGAEAKGATPLSASRETFKQYISKPVKIGLLGATQPISEYGIERMQGYDVKFQDAINNMGKGFTDFALMDLGMNVLTSPGKFAKSVVSSAKEYLANVDKQVLESMASKYREDGKKIISSLDGYNKARGKVAPYMPQELVHHVAGLQEAIDNKTAIIKGLVADENIPKSIIDTEQQQLNELKKRQEGIIETGKAGEFEIDDKTGEVVSKEGQPIKAETEIPKVELTEEQKKANIDQAAPEIRQEELDKIKQEYDTRTTEPTAEPTAEGVSGKVPSEPTPEIEFLKQSTPEQRADFEEWKSRTYKSESDIDAAYERSKLREYGQSRDEFIRGEYCK